MPKINILLNRKAGQVPLWTWWTQFTLLLNFLSCCLRNSVGLRAGNGNRATYLRTRIYWDFSLLGQSTISIIINNCRRDAQPWADRMNGWGRWWFGMGLDRMGRPEIIYPEEIFDKIDFIFRQVSSRLQRGCRGGSQRSCDRTESTILSRFPSQRARDLRLLKAIEN